MRRRLSPREAFLAYPVSQMKWTQIPNPEDIFKDSIDRSLTYLKDLYQTARIHFDTYISSLEYEILAIEKTKHTRVKYTNRKARKSKELDEYNDLPMVKEVLPNHIAKDRREEYPTVKECSRSLRDFKAS